MPANAEQISHERVGHSHASNSSSGSQTTRLTPDSDSEDSDLELKEDELGHSIKLQRRDPDKSQGADVDGPADEDDDDDRTPLGSRGSESTMHSYQLYTPDEERAVIRKFDKRLVLFVALLYMLSFLDRSSR
jgi:hypothetical protein